MHQPIDDHFLLRYRELLDAEDAAFDEVEHACEDGDRPHFDEEMVAWQESLAKKLSFLSNAGIDVPDAGVDAKHHHVTRESTSVH